jgi:hypothetical protein
MVLVTAHSQSLQAPGLHMAPTPGQKRPDAPEPARVLTPEAKRALAEAEERRRLADAQRAANPQPKEVGGRDGPDPTRYGDWEKNGIASDF